MAFPGKKKILKACAKFFTCDTFFFKKNLCKSVRERDYMESKMITMSMFIRKITSLLLFDVLFPHELIMLILDLYHKLCNRIKFSGHGHHSLCLKDGILYGSGLNTHYELGNDDHYATCCFVKSFIIKDADIVNVATGVHHSIIQTRDGKAFGFGYNSNGQLGLPVNPNESYLPLRDKYLIPLTNVVDISCGNFFSLIQTKNGLFSSGSNHHGCLGRNINYETNFLQNDHDQFKQIDIYDVISFRCSLWTVFILTKNGLYVHGNNQYKQLGISSESDFIYRPTPIGIDNVVSYFNDGFASLILTKSHLLLCDKTHFPPHKIDIKIPIIQCILLIEDDINQIVYTTSEGVYYTIWPNISTGVSISLFNKPVSSIHSAGPNGFFIESKEGKLYGIGSSPNGELGIGHYENNNDNIACELVFQQ